MRQTMTLLQRAVIDRLRKAGQSTIADEANAHWSIGLRVDGEVVLDIESAELRRDFERANAQVAAD